MSLKAIKKVLEFAHRGEETLPEMDGAAEKELAALEKAAQRLSERGWLGYIHEHRDSEAAIKLLYTIAKEAK